MPFTWITAIELLIKYGPEVTDFVMRKVKAGGEVSPEEWAELYALTQKTPRSQLLDAFARNGIPVDSDKAKSILAMLPPA